MKRYKSLLLQVGVLLFITAICISFLEQQKKFLTVDFSKQYGANKTIEVSGFEEGEQWRGNFSHDSSRVFEGKSSITFSSWYGVQNTIFRELPVALKNGYNKGYVSIYVADKKKLSSIESFVLELSDASKQTKTYTLTTQLAEGWNRVPLILPNWKSLNTVSFSLISKKGAIAEINLDRFWIENTTAYATDVFSTESQTMSLRTLGERTYLFSTSTTDSSYILTRPTSIKKGSVVVSIIPEHGKALALSMNGTAMKIGGAHMNECSLWSDRYAGRKINLASVSAKDDVYIFLKGEIAGQEIHYFVSNNGVDFESCGAVKRGIQTPISVSLKGAYLIDSLTVEY